jgi:exodeoxyribonuclease VIII
METHIERQDRVNWSTLKAIGVSPKHYLHLLNNPRADTDALRLGRVTHCLVFEPDQFNARYTVSPRFNRTMNDDTAKDKGYDGGRQAAAAWLASVGTREVVEAAMYTSAYGMALSVTNDPVAAPIVSSGWSERRIEWESDGIQCRGRVDHVNGMLADLKTTRSLVSFERDAARFGYHAQLAWYYDGLLAAGIMTENPPCLIAVESVPPYDVLVLTFDEDDLAVGRRVYRKCIERLAECRRTGMWPGVSGGVARRIVLPPWADPIVEDMEVIIDGKAVSL